MKIEIRNQFSSLSYLIESMATKALVIGAFRRYLFFHLDKKVQSKGMSSTAFNC